MPHPKTPGRLNEKNLLVLSIRRSLMAYNKKSSFILVTGQQSEWTEVRKSFSILGLLSNVLKNTRGFMGRLLFYYTIKKCLLTNRRI